MIINNYPQFKNYSAPVGDDKNKNNKDVADNSEGNINSIYNIPFKGLFSNNSKYIDARIRKYDIKMVPNKKYLVDHNALFYLNDIPVSLNNPEIQGIVTCLRPNKSVIIGREGILGSKLPSSVSRQHLEISKGENGEIYAKDLNSTNGTVIKTNTVDVKPSFAPFCLETTKSYSVPKDSSFKLNEVELNFVDTPRIKNMRNGEIVLVGRRYYGNDIEFDSDYVSKHHLKIEKYNNEYIVTDLNSTNGTTWMGTKKKPYKNLSQVSEMTYLKPKEPTLIPSDCQLCLGNDVVIDLRNQNIRNLFNDKDQIKIGKNADCDLVIEDFHRQTSRSHLLLEQKNDAYLATDMNSTNGTLVIPKNRAVPFFNGVENIEMQQGNIGDCYLLSSIYALAKNKYGRQYLNNMVKIDQQGNYYVTFYNKAPVMVRPDELDGQVSKNEKKRSVTGNLGVKAIERAYGKTIKDESIFNSNCTVYYLDQGGFTTKAITKMTGLNARSVNAIRDPKTARNMLNNIGTQDRDNFVVTCGTPNVSKAERASFPFVPRHAYAVGFINPRNETVEIINPHNTRNREVISWDTFTKYFDDLSWAYIKPQAGQNQNYPQR